MTTGLTNEKKQQKTNKNPKQSRIFFKLLSFFLFISTLQKIQKKNTKVKSS